MRLIRAAFHLWVMEKVVDEFGKLVLYFADGHGGLAFRRRQVTVADFLPVVALIDVLRILAFHGRHGKVESFGGT